METVKMSNLFIRQTMDKNNKTISGMSSLTLQEHRFIIYALYTLQKHHRHGGKIKINIKDYLSFWELANKELVYGKTRANGTSYDLVSVADSLRTFKKVTINDILENRTDTVYWFDRVVKYNKYIIVRFNPLLSCLELLNPQSKYTLINTHDLKRLSSQYSIRLYFILQSYRTFRHGNVKLPIQYFKKMLCIDDSTYRPSQVDKLIKKSFMEVETKTDLMCYRTYVYNVRNILKKINLKIILKNSAEIECILKDADKLKTIWLNLGFAKYSLLSDDTCIQILTNTPYSEAILKMSELCKLPTIIKRDPLRPLEYLYRDVCLGLIED